MTCEMCGTMIANNIKGTCACGQEIDFEDTDSRR